jgi:hypothetical protein
MAASASAAAAAGAGTGAGASPVDLESITELHSQKIQRLFASLAELQCRLDVMARRIEADEVEISRLSSLVTTPAVVTAAKVDAKAPVSASATSVAGCGSSPSVMDVSVYLRVGMMGYGPHIFPKVDAKLTLAGLLDNHVTKSLTGLLVPLRMKRVWASVPTYSRIEKDMGNSSALTLGDVLSQVMAFRLAPTAAAASGSNILHLCYFSY